MRKSNNEAFCTRKNKNRLSGKLDNWTYAVLLRDFGESLLVLLEVALEANVVRQLPVRLLLLAPLPLHVFRLALLHLCSFIKSNLIYHRFVIQFIHWLCVVSLDEKRPPCEYIECDSTTNYCV